MHRITRGKAGAYGHVCARCSLLLVHARVARAAYRVVLDQTIRTPPPNPS